MVEARYRDIRNTIEAHSIHGDISTYEDSTAITNEIKNIIFTDRYERFWNPTFGAGVPQTLFDNFGKDTEAFLESRIKESLKNYVSRAEILKVKIVPVQDRNEYSCTIVYLPKNALEPTTLDVILKRVR